MNTIIIKCFPCKFIDYLIIFFTSIVFNLIFILVINNFLILIEDKNPSQDYYLLIPRNIENASEKKDLIFKKLSLEKNIISVTKVKDDKIVTLLEKSFGEEKIPKDLVPDVYTIELDKKKIIEINNLNKIIDNVIPNTKIYKRGTEQGKKLNFFFIALVFIFTQSLLNFLLISNSFSNIKKIIIISKLFGSKRNNLFLNLCFGFLTIYVLSYLFIVVSNLLINFNMFLGLQNNNLNLEMEIILIYLIYYLLIKTFIISIVFNMQTKKIYT